MHKRELIPYLLEHQILITPEILSQIPETFEEADLKHYFPALNAPTTPTTQIYETPQETIQTQEPSRGRVTIVKSYLKEPKKQDVQSFVHYFRKRYETLRKMLESRLELQNSISINRLAHKQEGESVSLIGIITDKTFTKNGNIVIHLEDLTGITRIIATKTKEELFATASDLVLDEVIGVTGMTGKGIIFCNNLYFPEIPISHELKKAPDEAYVAFISDIHFGIKNFLADEFIKFTQWLKGEYGSPQQREMAQKVKYLFVTGDVVEGIGIYPGQEDDLAIQDITAQYDEAARYFRMIPEHIQIILCGGNHDAIRISEPQPPLDKKFAKALHELPNILMVSNPSVINIHASDGFPGFNVLMYHGYSVYYLAGNIPSIRAKGGQDRIDLIMQFLLQRRHLAPSHGSNLYIPDTEEDPLVISAIPDIFVTGHIHQIVAANYRNVTLINSSCWVTQSENQAKRGIVPRPARIPLVNLQTREVKIMNFNP